MMLENWFLLGTFFIIVMSLGIAVWGGCILGSMMKPKEEEKKAITVQELIEELKKLPPEAEVMASVPGAEESLVMTAEMYEGSAVLWCTK